MVKLAERGRPRYYRTLGLIEQIRYSRRFHRDLMSITIGEPDRKGSLIVEIYAGPSPSRSVPSCQVRVAEQDQAVTDFFGPVHATLSAA